MKIGQQDGILPHNAFVNRQSRKQEHVSDEALLQMASGGDAMVDRVLHYADRQAIFSVFPLLEREMHLTPVQLGLLGSSFAWVYGLSAPLAGNIIDRIRRKTAILGGLHAWSAICVATALSRNFSHLLFFRAAEGLGETFYFPASMSLVSDYHGKETRSWALGAHQTSVYMGTIGGGFFAGLIAQNYGWRWSFVVFGGLGILLGLVLRKSLIEPERGEGGPRAKLSIPEFLREVWGTPTAILLMGAFLCANFVAVVLLTWMPKFLHDKFLLSLAMAGFHGDRVRATGEHAGLAAGWVAGGTLARGPSRGTHAGASRGAVLRRAVRDPVRSDAVGAVAGSGADRLGTV